MFHVECPICKGLLRIDPRTKRVVSHQTAEESAQEKGDRFDSIMQNLAKSRSEQESRLEAAKRREVERKKHLDNQFDEARQRAREDPDGGKPMGPVWD